MPSRFGGPPARWPLSPARQLFVLAVIFAGAATLLVVTGSWQVGLAQGGYPPASKPINDYAGLLTPEDEVALGAAIERLRERHGIEAVVVTMASYRDFGTGDPSFEAFASRLFESRGIGHRVRQDGVLILVATADRGVRIEMGEGYGSEQNRNMRRVIQKTILPRFKRGDFSRGILRGAEAAFAHVTGKPLPEQLEKPKKRDHRPPGWKARERISGCILAATPFVGGGVMALFFVLARRFRESRCPRCGFLMKTRRETLSKPTLRTAGETRIDRHCRRCGLRDSNTVSKPPHGAAPQVSGGASSPGGFYSGGGFMGGRTPGGGSSGVGSHGSSAGGSGRGASGSW